MPPKAKAPSSIICLREPHFTDLKGNKWRHAMQIDFEGGAEWVSSIEWEDGCGAGWFEYPLLLLSIMAKLSAHSRQAFSLTRTVTPYICMPCVKICNKGKLEESWGWEHAQDVNYYFGSVFYINVSFPFFSHQEMIRLGWLSSPRSKTTERSCFAEWITHLSKIPLSKTPLSSMSIVSSAGYMTIFFWGYILRDNWFKPIRLRDDWAQYGPLIKSLSLSN